MLVEQIDQSSIVALIGLLGTVLPVGISYVLTKNKEIDVGIRQEKTERYDVLIGAVVRLSKSNPGDQEAFDNFTTAYNRAMAYASDLVLKRCNEFALLLEDQAIESESELLDETGVLERNRHIAAIFAAIRFDINPKAKYSAIGPLWTFRTKPKYFKAE